MENEALVLGAGIEILSQDWPLHRILLCGVSACDRSRKMQSDIHFCFLYCKSHDCHAWSQCKLSIASGGSEHSVTTNLTPVWDWESESCPHVQVCFVYSSWLWTCTGHSPNLEIDWGVLPTSTPFLPSDKRKETCWNQHGSPFVRRGLWWDDLGVEMGLAVL